ncbi:MAG: hypothetical protein ABJG78_08840 [Cyclobacteriaceae bacterium]
MTTASMFGANVILNGDGLRSKETSNLTYCAELQELAAEKEVY